MTEPLSSPESPLEPQIGDSFEVLSRHKPLLIGSVVLFGLLGAVYTLLVPPRYEAKTTILMPGSKPPSSAASLAQSLGVGGLGGNGDPTLPMFRKILESETVTAAVARKFGLKKPIVRQMRTIDDDAKTNTIDLAVQNKNKAIALSMANEFLSQLRQQNTKLSLPGKSKQAGLLATALAANSQALARSEVQLQRFVASAVTSPGMVGSLTDGGTSDNRGPANGVSPAFRYHDQLTTLSLQLQKLDNQLKVIDAKSVEASVVKPDDFPPVAIWNRRLSELEAALSAARATYSPDSPEVRDAQSSYDQVQKLLKKDVSKYLTAVERRVTGDVSRLDQDRASVVRQIASIRLLADAAPKEALQYQRLVRNVTTLTSLVSQLRVQYEQAKLESADDPNRWEVLDEPVLADDPVNKKYTRNVSLAALGGFFLAVPLAFRLGKRRR